MTLHKQVPTLPPQTPRAYTAPIDVRAISLHIIFVILFLHLSLHHVTSVLYCKYTFISQGDSQVSGDGTPGPHGEPGRPGEIVTIQIVLLAIQFLSRDIRGNPWLAFLSVFVFELRESLSCILGRSRCPWRARATRGPWTTGRCGEISLCCCLDLSRLHVVPWKSYYVTNVHILYEQGFPGHLGAPGPKVKSMNISLDLCTWLTFSCV